MSNDNVAHALAGTGGGILAMTTTYPLITLSTRAQTMSARSEAADKKTVGILEAVKLIVKKEGVSGLYSGLESALFGIALTNFVYYYFYEGTKPLFQSPTGSMSTGQSMAVGAIAGAITSVSTNPIWVVNTRMTVKGGKKSTIDTVKDVYKSGGLKAFFAGIGPALVLVINPVLQYTIFEQLRQVVEKKRKMTARDAFLIGALGKIVATCVTYPYITLKSRLQVRSKDEKGSSSLIQGIKDIIARDGVNGLYNGLTAKALQSALTSAFLFFFKEQLFSLAVALLAKLRSVKA